MQQCLQVNIYLVGLVGCAIPLLAAGQLRKLQQRHGRAMAEDEQEPEQEQEPVLAHLHQPFIATTLAWCCSEVAALALGDWPQA